MSPVPVTVRAAAESTDWPGGRRAAGGQRREAKETLSHKDGTALPETGMRSRDSFDRIRLQGSFPALAPALAPSLMSRHF